jgi:uncharacterized repeat protein (TIGR01451 family)
MGAFIRQFCIAATAAGLLAAAGSAAGQAVTVSRQGPWMVTLTSLPGGSRAHSINEAGEVVGQGLSPDGLTIRPIWLDGTVIGSFEGIAGNPYSWDSNRNAVGIHIVNSKISCNVWWTPVASGQFDECTGGAYDINESGESAGSARFTTPTVHRHVVTWKAGAVHRDLGLPPGAREAEGAGINDRGDVVGHLTDAASGRIEAFLYRDGQFTRLQSLPGPYASYAWDINNHGDIVGTSNGGVPVIWKGGSTTPTALHVPAGRYPRSVARINDSGDIVGTTTGIWPVSMSAVLWRGGEFIDLGVLPTGTEAYAYDLNNEGVIVGTSTTGTPYGWHAVTWTVARATGADLSLSMTDAPDPVRRGGTLVYTLVVRNDGPESGDSVTLTDALPSAVSLLSVRATQGSCAGTSTVTCSIGAMPPGAEVTISITVRARVSGTATNSANVMATTADPDMADNTAASTTKIGR